MNVVSYLQTHCQAVQYFHLYGWYRAVAQVLVDQVGEAREEVIHLMVMMTIMITIVISIIIITLPDWSYHYASQRDCWMALLASEVWSPSDWLGLRGRTCRRWLWRGRWWWWSSSWSSWWWSSSWSASVAAKLPFSSWYDDMLVHPWWRITVVVVPILVSVNHLGTP